MVSIIVPIYNAIEYLSACIESLIKQNYRDIEILLVDDGSTDKSKELCIKYAKMDRRIRYIEKENGGVSSARNLGLYYARGKYIAFVDADDYLDECIIGLAVKVMNDTDADMVGWNAYVVEESQMIKCREIQFHQDDFKYLQAALISNYNDKFYCGDYIRAVWGKLLKKSVICKNNILFREELYIGEDAVFLMEYISYVKKIVLTNEFGYYYRMLAGSAVRRYKDDLYQQSIKQIELIEKVINNDEVCEASQNALCVLRWSLLHDLWSNARMKKENRNFEDVRRWYKYMQICQNGKMIRAPWAGKLIRFQMLIGSKAPIETQMAIMEMYDKVKKIVGR